MSDELAERRKPWKKNLPPQLSPEEFAELDRRQREAEETPLEEIAGWAAHDGTYPTPDGEQDDPKE